jgi:uncharacterized C2H2 Zn-finger protein
MVFYCSLCNQTLKKDISYFCPDCESIFHYRCLVMKVKRHHQCPVCKSPGPLWKFWDGIPDSKLYEKPLVIRRKPTKPDPNPISDPETELMPDRMTQTAGEEPTPVIIPHKKWNRHLVLAVKAFFLLLFAAIGISGLVSAVDGGDIILAPVGIYFILVGVSFVSEDVKALTILITLLAITTAIVYSISQDPIKCFLTTPVALFSVIKFLAHLKEIRHLVFLIIETLVFIFFLTAYTSIVLGNVITAIVEVVLTFVAVYVTLRIFFNNGKKTGDFDIMYRCQGCGKLFSKEKMIGRHCKKCHSAHAAAVAHHGHPAFHLHPPHS